jgi:hypothetical protein
VGNSPTEELLELPESTLLLAAPEERAAFGEMCARLLGSAVKLAQGMPSFGAISPGDKAS